MTPKLEERARELHFALNSEACGFYDDGSGQNTQCLTCRDEIMPILTQVQAEARLAALEEAAQVVETRSVKTLQYVPLELPRLIRALAKAAAPAKEKVK